MEGMVELDVDATIAEMVSQKNMKIGARKKVGQGRKKKAQSDAVDRENLPGSAEGQNDNGPSGTAVSVFDYSVENHFRAIDRICKLCGEAEYHDLGKSEIERLSFSITFLREWRHFNYQPRVVQFACQSENSPQGKDVIGTITLPQFSAAIVPQKDVQNGNMISPGSNKDFVLYTGGPIWALDWCPRIRQRSDNHIKCEFIAVAAHPPESSYHKIGAPLIGRGVIQIWCLLSVGSKEEEASLMKKKPNKSTRNSTTVKVKSPKPKKPRGRPRKEPIHETVVNPDGDNECAKALEIVKVESLKPKKPRGRPRKNPVNENVVNLDGDNECVQSLEIVKVESPKLKKRRGGPAKKPVNEIVVNLDGNNECVQSLEIVKVKSPKLKKPRGRPAKMPVNETVVNLDGDNECVQALAVQFPGNSTNSLPVDIVSMDTQEPVAKRDSGWKRNGGNGVLSACDSVLTSVKRRRLKDKAGKSNFTHCDDVPLLTQNDNRECPPVNSIASLNSEQDPKNGSSESSTARCLIPKDVALPRIVLCLAHNGKLAWDVKWRPSNVHDTESKYRMGYLAVLLGNGALEVWEVPLPQTMKVIYSACQKEGTDPRFVKLEPIFRCSKLKFGGRQSIPLTVEWSVSSPHDFILAGCHDGVVALWKFSASATSEATDTKPLLCFSADTVPIRGLAWAPVESDSENANVIVTAGHRGLKFWDIRDPFRPLWDLNPVQRNIYSLDWLPDPRCVIVSFDDGTLRILSLVKAAYDVPVTGKPFVGTQQQGFHSYYCSSFAIWNVHVSRITGMVAYCSADGTVLRFQLTARAVEKDPLRNRVPHFLCGLLSVEESTLTVITPLPDIPFPMKKSLNEWSNAPRTIRGFLSESNQAKRAKEQMTKDQTTDGQNLALCYDDDPGIEIESEDALDSPKSQRPPKSRTTNKKKSKADQALACRDEEQENIQGDGEKGEVGDEIDVFPPKIVAMHRVRWNMNKGSERWLCYGGASGIVRCQEI